MVLLRSMSKRRLKREWTWADVGRYLVAKGDIQLRISDNTTDEEAATLGAGVITCGQALYQSLELPLPGSGKAGIWLLIYGGSTASGSLAIQ